MPAETRPIAASFSCAAARLHVAQVLEEQHAELLARRRLALAAVKRTRTRSVRCASGANCSGTSRPASGQAPSAKARSTARTQRPQAGDAAQLERRRAAHALGREQAARRRVGGAHLAARGRPPARRPPSPRSPGDSAAPAGAPARGCRARSAPRAPAGRRARRRAAVTTKKPLPARPGLRHQQRRVAAGDACRATRSPSSSSVADRRGRQREHARRQHAGHQHRQHQQGDVVEARPPARRRAAPVKSDQVDADRRQPLRAAQARDRLRRRRRGESAAAATC